MTVSSHPLGNWRLDGLTQSDDMFEAHSITESGNLALLPNQNIYTPPDIGQFFWTAETGFTAPQGSALVTYQIRPRLQ